MTGLRWSYSLTSPYSTVDKSQGHLCQWDAGKSRKDHHDHLNSVLCVMDKLIYKFKEQSKSWWGNCQSLFFHKSRDGCNLRCWNFTRSCAGSVSLQNSKCQKSWETKKIWTDSQPTLTCSKLELSWVNEIDARCNILLQTVRCSCNFYHNMVDRNFPGGFVSYL